MECQKYRPEGEKVWSIVFKHPTRLNSDGEFGRWTRRTLDTTDSKVADSYVNEMKEILSSKELWLSKNRDLAAKKYSKVIISAFYESIIPENQDIASTQLRENLLPLPSDYDGYKKILFMGTTGAGKTTLLRHLIGTSGDKFPLTTTAKPTISDLEVIVCEGNYRCVVTFFQESMVRFFVENCIYNAIIKAENVTEKHKIAETLFENKEQTFRLNHIIGKFITKRDDKQKSLFEEDEDTIEEPTNCDVNKVINKVEYYIDKIILIANESKTEYLSTNAAIDDFDVETFQDLVLKNYNFKSLVDEVMNDIKSRFEYINCGFLSCNKSEWPIYWEYESKEKSTFLEILKVFSSNDHTLFGRLLSPLVEGMRIQGPLFPAFVADYSPKLVFIDGQGLGHIAESAGSQPIPKKLENMFGEVDTILLVDSAQQPMQNTPLAAMNRVIVSGYANQLMIAFTHFDAVEGDNFETEKDKKHHVYMSVKNGLHSFEKEIGKTMVMRLEDDLENRCFFLSHLNKNDVNNKATINQLTRLLKNPCLKIQTQKNIISKPIYSSQKVDEIIHKSIEYFRMRWDLRLNGGFTRGYSYPYDMSQAKSEHWKKIWALNRRIVEFGSIEYEHLRPVNELKTLISVQITAFLDEPLEWIPNEPADAAKFEFTDSVRRIISGQLGNYIEYEMIDVPKSEWIRTFQYKGTGSTKLRANEIESIYDRIACLKRGSDDWKSVIQKIETMLESSIVSVHESMKENTTEKYRLPSNFINLP